MTKCSWIALSIGEVEKRNVCVNIEEKGEIYLHTLKTHQKTLPFILTLSFVTKYIASPELRHIVQ